MKKRLSFILFSIIITLNFFSCNTDSNNKLIEGDLYFDWLHFGSFYNQPDSIIDNVKLYADTVNRKQADSVDLNILAMYDILKKEDLLYKPFIDLKLDNGSLVKMYFTNDEYDKIKIYKRKDLLDTKKKIRIKAEVHDLGMRMVLSIKVVSIIKLDGQTLQRDKKFKIEDYN